MGRPKKYLIQVFPVLNVVADQILFLTNCYMFSQTFYFNSDLIISHEEVLGRANQNPIHLILQEVVYGRDNQKPAKYLSVYHQNPILLITYMYFSKITKRQWQALYLFLKSKLLI